LPFSEPAERNLDVARFDIDHGPARRVRWVSRYVPSAFSVTDDPNFVGQRCTAVSPQNRKPTVFGFVL
jgi:hypothetical protein